MAACRAIALKWLVDARVSPAFMRDQPAIAAAGMAPGALLGCRAEGWDGAGLRRSCRQATSGSLEAAPHEAVVQSASTRQFAAGPARLWDAGVGVAGLTAFRKGGGAVGLGGALVAEERFGPGGHPSRPGWPNGPLVG